MKKLVVIILLISGVAAAAYYKIKGNQDSTAADAAAAAAPKTIKVGRGTIDLKVSTTGKVVSNLDVEIKSKASGQITELPYDVSDKVTSGALLAVLDPVDERRNVYLREAALGSARARLIQAEQQLQITENDANTITSSTVAELEAARIKFAESTARMDRQEDLFRKKLISNEEMDVMRSEISASQRALREAEVRVAELVKLPRTIELRRQDVQLQQAALKQSLIDMENAQQRLTETKIFASMDGVITSRPVQTGQIIASGISNVGGGTSLMTLSDLSRLFVNANVDESDIGKVNVGQRATITADAYPGKRFRGKVVRVASKGVTNSNVVTFEVKLEVEGEGHDLLKPEMTANVDIQADRRQDVLVLPNEAIQFGREGYYVTLPSKDSTTSAPRLKIKPGITDGLNTEIAEGLEENQEIAVSSTMQSRWARSADGGAGGAGASNFNRGLQRAAFSVGGGGSRGGGGGRGPR